MSLKMSLKKRNLELADYIRNIDINGNILGSRAQVDYHGHSDLKSSKNQSGKTLQSFDDNLTPNIIPSSRNNSHSDRSSKSPSQKTQQSGNMENIGDVGETVIQDIEEASVIWDELLPEEIEEYYDDQQDPGYDTYSADLDVVMNSHLTGRNNYYFEKDYSFGRNLDPEDDTFTLPGHLRLPNLPNNPYTTPPGRPPDNDCEALKIFVAGHRYIRFYDMNYAGKYQQLLFEEYLKRALFHGEYRIIDVSHLTDANLSDFKIEFSTQIWSVFHGDDDGNKGPPFIFGVTAIQKDICPNNLRFYNYLCDPPPRLQGNMYCTPYSEEMQPSIIKMMGPNTQLHIHSAQGNDPNCNWKEARSLGLTLTCKYIEKIVIFVAFSDYLIDLCLPRVVYNGFMSPYTVKITEQQLDPYSAFSQYGVDYIPMKYWVH